MSLVLLCHKTFSGLLCEERTRVEGIPSSTRERDAGPGDFAKSNAGQQSAPGTTVNHKPTRTSEPEVPDGKKENSCGSTSAT